MIFALTVQPQKHFKSNCACQKFPLQIPQNHGVYHTVSKNTTMSNNFL